MVKMRGFLLGLGGGGSALRSSSSSLLGVSTSKRPRRRSSRRPSPAAGHLRARQPAALTPDQIYTEATGVVEIQSRSPRPARHLRPATGGTGARHGLRRRQAGLHPHQRPRRVRTGPEAPPSVTVSFNKAARKTSRSRAQIVGIDTAADVAVIKVDPAGPDPQPAAAGRLPTRPGRRAGGRHRQPARLDFTLTSGIVSAIGRSLAGAERHAPSSTASRPTPPSTPATRAVR